MYRIAPCLAASLLLSVLAACGQQSSPSAAHQLAASAIAGAEEALAHSHSVHIEVAAERMPRAVTSVRTACAAARFGSSSLVEIEESRGEYPSATIVVRTVPAAVAPLTALAGEGGEVRAQSERIDNIADARNDTVRARAELERQRDELRALQKSAGLTIADRAALAGEIAAVETRLAVVESDAAEQRRRLERSLLRIEFVTVMETDFADELGATTANTLRDVLQVLFVVVPLAIIAFPLALLWRALWRRATRGDASGGRQDR